MGSKPHVPPPPPPPPPAPDPVDTEVLNAKRRERQRLMGMAGRASTFRTGALGVEGAVPVASKTLLGA